MAGTGKSTISLTVAEMFHTHGRLGASFFFSRGQGDLGNATKLFINLSAMLLRQIPELLKPLKEALEDDPAIFRKGLRQQWKSLLLQPLQKVTLSSPQSAPIIILIDALDECENNQDVKLILESFSQIVSIRSLQIRIFLTSRPEHHIGSGFRQNLGGSHHCFVLHEIEAQVVDADIRRYFRSEMDSICEEFEIPEDLRPGSAVIQTLCERAGQLFIYASTVCLLLRDILPFEGFEEGLETIMTDYRGLDEVYLGVLKHAVRGFNKPALQHRKEKLIGKLKQVIGSIVMLFSPLSPDSLSALLSKDREEIQPVLNSLRSILEVSNLSDDEETIRLLHPSFRDFLIDESRCSDNLFWVKPSETHGVLFGYCLDLMSRELKADMCDLRLPGYRSKNIDKSVIDNAFSPELQYAVRYWGRHLQLSDLYTRSEHCYNTSRALVIFLRKHFLNLVEALTLLGLYLEGIQQFGAIKIDLENVSY